MPSTSSLRSDVAALVVTLPTVKEAVLAKQGIRALRDEMLYKHDRGPLSLDDGPRLAEIGITPLLLQWMHTPAGQPIQQDLTDPGADAVLAAFHAAEEKIEVVRLTLAYAASTDDLVRFHQWFKATLGHPLMLDVAIDPKIIGGFTAMYHDHYLDYSVAAALPKVEEKIQQQFQAYA
jgi:hypothetical protein